MAFLSRLLRRSVSSDIEKQLITGIIVSDRICGELYQILNLDYLQIDYVKIITKWVFDYYIKYKEAPYTNIQSIYNVEKANLKEAEMELISSFLFKLSERLKQEEEFNIDYLLDKILQYVKERSLIVTSQRVIDYVNAGKPNEAEKELQEYKKVARAVGGFINPFEKKYIATVIENYTKPEEERAEYLYRLPGQLGEFIGHFETGWLIAFEGPMKRGKTWWLQELTLQAIFEHLKVVFISLEMNSYGITKRFYQIISNSGDKPEYLYPIFDCYRNQTGTCKDSKRKGVGAIREVKGEKPPFNDFPNHIVCTECRGTSKFNPDNWYTKVNKSGTFSSASIRNVEGFAEMYQNRLRIKAYPAYSASIGNIKNDLANLETIDDFIPNIIVVDYADILAPENSRLEGREKHDEVWKMLKNLASSRNCLVITATQSNRATLEKKNVKASDVSEDIRKVAHVDAMFSLNQTPVEKKAGVMRIGVVAHRWKDFHELDHVMVLQQMGTGQVMLDSEVRRVND